MLENVFSQFLQTNRIDFIIICGIICLVRISMCFIHAMKNRLPNSNLPRLNDVVNSNSPIGRLKRTTKPKVTPRIYREPSDLFPMRRRRLLPVRVGKVNISSPGPIQRNGNLIEWIGRKRMIMFLFTFPNVFV